MLIDKVTITVKAGNGGNGAVTFKRNAQTAKGGPDGGNGGNGGSVYIQGSTNISDLREFQFKKKIKAEDGVSGKKNNLFGRNGEDILVRVPLGTKIVTTEDRFVAEITNDKAKICIAKGGKGGRGNNEFKSATNQTPMEAEDGEPGEQLEVIIELRLIADVGFVGLPNAGKSSLLKALTNAKPKIGNYPFTTLEPNLGIAGGIILADIPGVIKGASKGKGLGFKFLKHIEKTRFLVYCIDATEKNPFETYATILSEFEAYNQTLLEKPKIVLLTKTDLVTKDALLEKEKLFTDKKEKVFSVSIYENESIENLEQIVRKNSDQ